MHMGRDRKLQHMHGKAILLYFTLKLKKKQQEYAYNHWIL